MLKKAVGTEPESMQSRGDAYLSRATALAPMLAAAAARIEAERELPAEILVAMHEAQLFRPSLPRFLGGAELAPPLLARITEAVAMVEPSAAWCLGQGYGCAMSAAFLDEAPARQVFGAADAVLAWGAGNAGRAAAVKGGYRVSGSWRFASGGKHATWLGAHSKVFEADGSPRRRADGRQANRTLLFPRASAQIADDWYVMGLKGTRSEGYTVEDLFVPDELTLDREDISTLRCTAPLYKFPMTIVYAGNFSGVALGIARAALDDLKALAHDKTPRAARSSLRESQLFQTRLAELEAQVESARAWQRQVMWQAWEKVERTGEVELADRAPIRLATTWAINQATAAVEQVYRLAGSTALMENQPFERRFRDMHGVSQQMQARSSNYENVGRFMLDLEVDPSAF
jgi:alkylation response protein AidB-like acyl-CoA dehydrogenase